MRIVHAATSARRVTITVTSDAAEMSSPTGGPLVSGEYWLIPVTDAIDVPLDMSAGMLGELSDLGGTPV